ncbi:MAG: L-lactate dehydrogenase [Fusobacteriaceae bacterium]|jgi:L-lactate dehydrogenase|nr:L-lactate dehydrogenase [Fusobacteriaceae bacterium]
MDIQRKKMGIIGAGHVGSHVGLVLSLQGVCDEIVMVDIDKDKAYSQALDCMDAAPFCPNRVTITAGEMADLKDADMVVISVGSIIAGDRLAERDISVGLVKQVIPDLMKTGFNGYILVITNPCDIITYAVWKLSGLPSHKVIGTGTGLDSSRLKRILSKHSGVDPHSIDAYMIGEHGDSQFAALSCASFAGKKMTELMKEKPEVFGKLDFDAISTEAAQAGWEVFKGKKSTEFGIACTLARLANAIYRDEKKIFPVSTLFNGEYGYSGVYAGVPAVVGQNGVEYIIELPISEDEKKKLERTMATIRKHVESTGL